MIVTTVTVFVKKEYIDAFIAATEKNHTASVKEAGNLRFDILQSREDPTRFMLYEAYVSDDAAKAHKQTAHYLTWRKQVADWMAQPRRGVAHDVLFPRDLRKW